MSPPEGSSLTLPAMPVDGLTFSQNGRLLVVNNGHGGLHTTTLSNSRTTVSHGWPTHCADTPGQVAPSAVAISDDDRLEAVSSNCGLLRIGHTGAPGPFETFHPREKIAGHIAFNPAGTQLALVESDSSAIVLSVATDRRVLELLGHTRVVGNVIYSPMGDLMATTSFDDTLRIWNASTGELLQTDPDNSFTHPPAVQSRQSVCDRGKSRLLPTFLADTSGQRGSFRPAGCLPIVRRL